MHTLSCKHPDSPRARTPTCTQLTLVYSMLLCAALSCQDTCGLPQSSPSVSSSLSHQSLEHPLQSYTPLLQSYTPLLQGNAHKAEHCSYPNGIAMGGASNTHTQPPHPGSNLSFPTVAYHVSEGILREAGPYRATRHDPTQG